MRLFVSLHGAVTTMSKAANIWLIESRFLLLCWVVYRKEEFYFWFSQIYIIVSINKFLKHKIIFVSF